MSVNRLIQNKKSLVIPPDHIQAASLTQQGIDALKEGQRSRARVLLARALKLNPDNERAWLWLSGAVESDDDRRHCLRRVLAINPRNAAARAGLAQLEAALVVPPVPSPSLSPSRLASVAPVERDAVPAPQPPDDPQPTEDEQSPAVLAQDVQPESTVPPVLPTPPPAVALPTTTIARPSAPDPRRFGRRVYLAGLVYDLLVLGIAVLAWLFVGGIIPVRVTSIVPANAPAPTDLTALPSVAAVDASPTAPRATATASPAATSAEAAATTGPASRPQIVIEDRGTAVSFPDRLTFSARVASIAGLDQVVLEYGVKKLTCGAVVARAFPTFKPGLSANVEWTWEMSQSGSEPPGTIIWYRWHVIDKAGDERVSDEQQAVWLDNKHQWHSLNREGLTLHWYDEPPAFAEDLLGAATGALGQLGQTTGVAAQGPIDLYIYANSTDMRDAVLYEPGWSGGLAFPDHAIVIIGIGQDQLDWGRRATAHELTHVLVGRRAFGCIGSIPTWLDEGIAVVGQGGPEQEWQAQLQAAIKANTLLSVRTLSGGFSEQAAQADLSYAQSYSLVNYLISSFGSEKLLALFDELRAGTPVDAALTKVYTFGVDGLEDRWRASVRARVRPGSRAAPTATALPTPVPTYAPINSTVNQ